MRLALPGSALVHAGAVSLLFVGFVWPKADDAAAPAPVTVNIIPLSTVASNATEVLTANNTVSSLSAGGQETIEETPPETLDPMTEQVEPQEAEPVEPLAQELLEPVEEQSVAPEQASTVEPIEAEPIDAVELSTTAESALSIQPVTPVQVAPQDALEVASLASSTPPQSLEPVETQTLVTPPAMPTPVSQRPPDQPKPREVPRETPREAKSQPPKPAAPQTAGNGGNSQADSSASAGGAQPLQSNNGNGGEAEVARYPSQVIGKLRNAMRRGGDRGEMIVRFTVGAGGDLQGVSVARSSGNPSVDAAGTALVQRAAPFPPIPAAAARNSWTFDVPLAFGG
ncbi:energy transducer TonB family protein [Devosia rhizoryzae]|uniref:Energy transducer TonB n=1 Tax=Devosia rhizoryzae TaxID=2774137 RepID=A0ABX7C1G4_9HYPH|nr:TonB family protein [Devosia rhizoryzae]QQR38070.1 energy transducer TonB [Devosia rhizoryzae]